MRELPESSTGQENADLGPIANCGSYEAATVLLFSWSQHFSGTKNLPQDTYLMVEFVSTEESAGDGTEDPRRWSGESIRTNDVPGVRGCASPYH